MQSENSFTVESGNFNSEMHGDGETQDLMSTIVYIAPFIQKLVPLDCVIAIADREKFLKLLNAKSFKIPHDLEGRPVPPKDNLYIAMKDNKVVQGIIPKNVCGFEFQLTSVPIINKEGHVVGGLSLGIGLENRQKLIDLAKSVASSSQGTSAIIEELTRAAERLAEFQTNLKQLGQEVAEEVNKTADILEFIHNIAQNSNLLGLNAAIEAARAGEHGRGFAVVAEEIRKMADNSANAVKDIGKITSIIQNKTKQMTERVMETAAIGEEQLAASEEIASAMEELAASAEQLEKAAFSVIG